MPPRTVVGETAGLAAQATEPDAALRAQTWFAAAVEFCHKHFRWLVPYGPKRHDEVDGAGDEESPREAPYLVAATDMTESRTAGTERDHCRMFETETIDLVRLHSATDAGRNPPDRSSSRVGQSRRRTRARRCEEGHPRTARDSLAAMHLSRLCRQPQS